MRHTFHAQSIVKTAIRQVREFTPKGVYRAAGDSRRCLEANTKASARWCEGNLPVKDSPAMKRLISLHLNTTSYLPFLTSSSRFYCHV